MRRGRVLHLKPPNHLPSYLVSPRKLGTMQPGLPQQVPEVHERIRELSHKQGERDIGAGTACGPTGPGANEASAVVEQLHPVVFLDDIAVDHPRNNVVEEETLERWVVGGWIGWVGLDGGWKRLHPIAFLDHVAVDHPVGGWVG